MSFVDEAGKVALLRLHYIYTYTLVVVSRK